MIKLISEDFGHISKSQWDFSNFVLIKRRRVLLNEKLIKSLSYFRYKMKFLCKLDTRAQSLILRIEFY